MSNHNKQEYWFKQQYHVWAPTSWQGVAVVSVFLLVTIGNVAVFVINPYSNELLWLYLNILATAVASLLIIGSAKGPRSDH